MLPLLQINKQIGNSTHFFIGIVALAVAGLTSAAYEVGAPAMHCTVVSADLWLLWQK